MYVCMYACMHEQTLSAPVQDVYMCMYACMHEQALSGLLNVCMHARMNVCMYEKAL